MALGNSQATRSKSPRDGSVDTLAGEIFDRFRVGEETEERKCAERFSLGLAYDSGACYQALGDLGAIARADL